MRLTWLIVLVGCLMMLVVICFCLSMIVCRGVLFVMIVLVRYCWFSSLMRCGNVWCWLLNCRCWVCSW